MSCHEGATAQSLPPNFCWHRRELGPDSSDNPGHHLAQEAPTRPGGLGCIWKPEKKSWERVFSLKVADCLASWPEATLSPELQRYLEGARERARKPEEYYRRRARAAAKDKLALL